MAVIFDSWVTEIFSLLATIFVLIFATFKIKYNYWKKKGIPSLEPSFPLGNAWNTALMKKSTGEDMKDTYAQTEGMDVVGIYAICSPILVVRDPELIKTIIVKDFNYFPDRGIHVDAETDHLTNNLFFLGGQKWRSLRQKLSPTFTSGKMRAMYSTVRDCARTLVEVTPLETDVEVRDLIARYSTDVIASCAFGIEVDSQHNPQSEFRQWGKRFFEPSWRAFFTQALGFSNPSLRKVLPVPFTPKDISEYFTRVVDDTVKYREQKSISRKDFMQLLIQIKNRGYVDESFSATTQSEIKDETQTLTTNQLAAQAWVFFLAGFETSSTTVSFCLHELSKHQDIQKRLQQEVDEVMKKDGGEVTYETIFGRMPYLDKVVNETLRVYPPVPVLNREAAADYKLPGRDCVLEKGTKLIIPVMGLHHDRKYFRNAGSFDPEHFSEDQVAARHPFSYLPFGDGPRICIGMRFGLMQVKLALTHLLSQYTFLPTKTSSKELHYAPNNLVLTPIGGIELRVRKRTAPAC